MGKRSEDWIPFHGWDSRDWGQAAMVAGGVALGALTGGALAPAGWTGLLGMGGAATGAVAGGILGTGKAYEDQLSEDAGQEAEKVARKQEAEARNNEILRKQSLMSAHNTMTAREAMARNINAAIKKMYSPKTASNNPNPYALGGEKEVLG